MTETTLRKAAFWMFVVFVPVALAGSLLRWLTLESRLGSILIIIGLIGALAGLIVLKIAGAPQKERE